MALDSTISGWKSAGTYRVEIDQTVINNDQINVGNTRLVVGFSKQGPINTPILITNSKQFTNLFGQIDRSLENKGSYFHRTVLTCLSAGPVLVLNLLNIDPDTDQVQEKTFSVSTSKANKDMITLPLLGCYNTDKFWEASAASFGDAINNWLGTNLTNNGNNNQNGYQNEIISFTNISKKPMSILVKRASAFNTQNYNMTLSDWYGAGNVPEYLNPTSIVSDYMVDVYIVEGNFGPAMDKHTAISTLVDVDDDGQKESVNAYTISENGYKRFFSDINYQSFFDEDGFIRKVNTTDTTDTNLTKFFQLPSVNLVASYTGCLIPNFINKIGINLWIQKLINDDVNTTGILCYENIDALENVTVDSEGTIIENIDIIGHNIDINNSKEINMLSYKCSLEDGSDSDTYSDIAEAIEIVKDVELDTPLNTNEVLISNDNKSIVIGSYLVSKIKINDNESITTTGRLTRVYDIKTVTGTKDGSTASYKKVIAYDIIALDENESNVFKFTTIDEYCNRLQWISLNGFKLTDAHIPGYGKDKTKTLNEQQNTILEMLSEYSTTSNLYKTLGDRDFISWRYLVDSFGNGLEENSKTVYTRLCNYRKSAIAIINCPSVEDFKKSRTPGPSFTNTRGTVESEYIAKGGNPAKPAEFRFTLPRENDGATYGAYYYPYIKIMDQGAVKTVPPAAFVSNLFLDKYKSGYPWTLVAGERNGVISGNQSVNVESTILHDNRNWLEPAGINSIIWDNGVGITIYANKTAKQSPVSALSSIHVREALIYIEDYVEEILRRYIFSENTSIIRSEIKSIVDNFLESVMKSGGLYDFKTVMDTSNNTKEVIDANHGIIDIYIEPVKGLEILTQRITILKTGSLEVSNRE